MCVWVEVNRYHRKPDEEEKKKNDNESNYIYIHIYHFFLNIYINETINTTTITII
jgi:hypothetical protein